MKFYSKIISEWLHLRNEDNSFTGDVNANAPKSKSLLSILMTTSQPPAYVGWRYIPALWIELYTLHAGEVGGLEIISH